MTVHAGMQGQSLRQRRTVSRAGQPGADGLGHQGPAVGRRLAELSRSARRPARSATACSIFEDTDGDGKADKVTHFIDDLNCPDRLPVLQGRRAAHAGAGSVVRARHRRRRQSRLERARAHGHGLRRLAPHRQLHVPRSRRRDVPERRRLPRTQVETADGPVRNNDAGIYRFEPRTGKFETLHLLRLRQPARPRLRLLGQRHRHRRHRQQHLLRPRRSAATRLSGQASQA